MKINEGAADRGIRLVLGIVAVVIGMVWLGALAGSIPGIAVAAIGVVLVVTGLVGFCPAYSLVGIRTCQLKN